MKTLLKSLKEYREWAFNILNEHGDRAAESLGLIPDNNCYDYNEKNEPIDEAGNVLIDDTAETIKVEDWVNELTFPLIVIHLFEKGWDRTGDLEIIFAEFVELKDFN